MGGILKIGLLIQCTYLQCSDDYNELLMLEFEMTDFDFRKLCVLHDRLPSRASAPATAPATSLV